VLTAGGAFSIATWAEAEHNPYLTLAREALLTRIPASRVPDLRGSFTSMAAPGVREQWLSDAGMTEVTSRRFTWPARFSDFDGTYSLPTTCQILWGRR
jgi:hypothetical protein